MKELLSLPFNLVAFVVIYFNCIHIHILLKYYYYRFGQSTIISVYRHKCLFLFFILSVSLRSHLGSLTFLLQNGFYISCPILKVKVTQSWLTLCNSMDYYLGQNTGLGSLSLLQGIFPTQGLNLGLPHCRFFTF